MLADGAQAWLNVLRRQVGMDSTRIGLSGFSQGGDVIPLTADFKPAVRFVSAVSSLVILLPKQIRDRLRMMAEDEGLDAAAQKLVAELHQLSLRYTTDETNWAVFNSALQDVHRGSCGGTSVIQGFPAQSGAAIRGYVSRVADYDPLFFGAGCGYPRCFGTGARTGMWSQARARRFCLTRCPPGVRIAPCYFSRRMATASSGRTRWT